VSDIADGLHLAGVYSRTLDVGNLPAGVYYVRLETGRDAAIEKVVLLE
jgi:hypothetical protein